MDRWRKKIFFSLIILLLILMLAEILLRFSIFTYARRKGNDAIPLMIKDERLEHRPNPRYPGHDLKGFRNRVVPQEASVVALGDSQTYGVGVPLDNAWPQQLEMISGLKTYNMAFGGYGPAHSLVLLEEALELKPKLIIEAFYAGNDLYDAYHLIYDLKQLPELETSDNAIMEQVKIRERLEPLAGKISRLFRMEKQINPRGLTASNIRLYGLLMTVINTFKLQASLRDGTASLNGWERIKEYARDNNDFVEVLDSGNVRTVFTPRYRLCALDLSDPRINEGLRISLEAIKIIRDRLKSAGVDFTVLLIPTKEAVFKNVVYRESDNISSVYQELVNCEEEIRQKMILFLKQEGIDFVDALPFLRHHLELGKQPYPISWNGHPNSLGQEAITQAVVSKIKEDI